MDVCARSSCVCSVVSTDRLCHGLELHDLLAGPVSFRVFVMRQLCCSAALCKCRTNLLEFSVFRGRLKLPIPFEQTGELNLFRESHSCGYRYHSAMTSACLSEYSDKPPS